ncbi:MAG: TonB-dependent receptor [Pseudohongiellaceae bacterium]|nr:TonB-dependent receptor [Pseudohongiellaceae bacterium]
MSDWSRSPRVSLLTSAILSALYGPAVLGQADENPPIEEVVVVGSYLRGSPIDAPSPVQVIDRSAMEQQGAAQLWDVVKNLEVNSGSVTNIGSGELEAVQGIANINLRNLGENSTLVLLNGKRQVSAATTTRSGGEMVDINAIPQVMVQRLELLTDGGSALYGSDAVAGVANFIMRTEFEGFELYVDEQRLDKAFGLGETTLSGIWGWSSDNSDTHFVLAGERYDREAVPVKYARFFDENTEYADIVGAAPQSAMAVFATPDLGSNLNTAFINYDVVARNIAEGGQALPVYTDPLCSSLMSSQGEPFFVGRRADERGLNTGHCLEDTSDWENLSYGQERDSIAASFTHAFSDSAQFYSFAQWSGSRIARTDNGAVFGRGPTVFLAAPGTHTGNPLLGGYAVGQSAELGYFAPAIGLARPTSIPNVPNAIANGGINAPMYTNVRVNTPRVGGDDNISDIETLGLQAGVKGEFFALDDRRFDYDVSYSWSGSSFEQSYRTLQRDRAELAANGLGGPNCTPNGTSTFDWRHAPGPFGGLAPTFWNFANGAIGDALTQTFFPGFVFNSRETLSLALTSNNHGQDGCQFYNPYLTALTNPDLANSQELVDWMAPRVLRADKRNKLGVFDAVLSGELVEMAGGMAQFALGAQYRQQENKSRAPQINLPGIENAILGYDENGVPNEFHYLSNNLECSYCIFNYDNHRNVKAVFTELSMPILENVETQFALRWESYGGNIGSEVTPKIAASWRPLDSLMFRGSFSQSFRAPNVGIVEEGLEGSQTTFRDPIRNQAVRAGLLPPTNANALPNTTYTLSSPAPDIGNERADTYNLGFLWTPDSEALRGLSIGADLWRFELKDKVLPQPGISAIQGELEAFKVAAADPDNYVLNSSLSGNAPVPYESCNPDDIAAQYGEDSSERLDCVVDPRTYVVPNVVRTFGSTSGQLTTTVLSTINAGTIITDGVDLKMAYDWSSDLGYFRLGLNYTHVNQYKLKGVPGLDLGLLETGTFDAAGTTGDGNLVRSLPDNKGNITLSWMRDRHALAIITRLIGSYRDLSYQSTFDGGNDLVRSLVRKKIDSYQTWDMQYSYTKDWGNDGWGTTTFTLGVIDAFNAEIPYREDPNRVDGLVNYDASVFDGRGRRFYARALLQF